MRDWTFIPRSLNPPRNCHPSGRCVDVNEPSRLARPGGSVFVMQSLCTTADPPRRNSRHFRMLHVFVGGARDDSFKKECCSAAAMLGHKAQRLSSALARLRSYSL